METKAVKLVNENEYLHPTELKDGDFIKIWSNLSRFIYIFKKCENNIIYRHASFDLDCNEVNVDSSIKWGKFIKSTKITYATEEEKDLLNAALLKEGYIWNNSTKELEENTNKEELNLFPTKKHYQLNFNY